MKRILFASVAFCFMACLSENNTNKGLSTHPDLTNRTHAHSESSLLAQQSPLSELNSAPLSEEEMAIVKFRADRISAKTARRFYELLEQWENAIHTDMRMMLSSSTMSYKELPEYKALRDMGKEILPLVAKELTNREKFPLLVLYDDLQDDTARIIKYSVNDKMRYEGEQNRAIRTIRKYIQ